MEQDQARKVPVLRSENSLIEEEFDSIRGRFEEEMRKMESEMAKFRSQLISSMASSNSSLTTRSSKQTSSSKTSSSSSSSSSSTRTATDNNEGAGRRLGEFASPPSRWLDEFVATNSPLIKSSPEDGNKVLKLRFDVSAYEPDQIMVKTIDNKLQVHARRQESSANRSLFSEYNKEFLLPEGTQPELIKSCLSADGILTIESPLPISVSAADHRQEDSNKGPN